jgi:7-cyano-7-deazaguanine synthase
MEAIMPDSAIVLFSGGQDSTVCLAWALDQFANVETVGFDYGQRHSVELVCRKEILRSLADRFPIWRDRLGADHVLDLGLLGEISDTSLTRDVEIQFREDGLPTTFVPGRNLLFFTLAAAIAYRRGHRHLVGGMCETDYSGYPDCRDDTLKSLQVTLNLGMSRRLVLHTPLMWVDKAQTWRLAEQLGGTVLVDLIREQSHSCYLGERSTRQDWGYGCGRCPACKLRQRGYDQYVTNAKAA